MSQALESARTKKILNRKLIIALTLAALLSALLAKIISDLAFS